MLFLSRSLQGGDTKKKVRLFLLDYPFKHHKQTKTVWLHGLAGLALMASPDTRRTTVFKVLVPCWRTPNLKLQLFICLIFTKLEVTSFQQAALTLNAPIYTHKHACGSGSRRRAPARFCLLYNNCIQYNYFLLICLSGSVSSSLYKTRPAKCWKISKWHVCLILCSVCKQSEWEDENRLLEDDRLHGNISVWKTSLLASE